MRSVKFALLTGILAGMLVAGAGYADDPLFDVVIEHGRVMDPESGLDAVRSIGIAEGVVRMISGRPLRGKRTIDAAGLVVAPGFIDLHWHGTKPESHLYQAMDGVTASLELEIGVGDIDRWYAERLAQLLDRMSDDSDGPSVLDSSVVLSSSSPPSPRPPDAPAPFGTTCADTRGGAPG